MAARKVGSRQLVIAAVRRHRGCLQHAATELGITRERVRQIVMVMGGYEKLGIVRRRDHALQLLRSGVDHGVVAATVGYSPRTVDDLARTIRNRK